MSSANGWKAYAISGLALLVSILVGIILSLSSDRIKALEIKVDRLEDRLHTEIEERVAGDVKHDAWIDNLNTRIQYLERRYMLSEDPGGLSEPSYRSLYTPPTRSKSYKTRSVAPEP